MKKLILSASFLALSLGLTGCGGETQSSLQIPESENLVLQSQTITPSLSLSGTVEALKSVSLSSKISGRIDTLPFDVGDQVTKGQVVAKFSVLDDQTQIAYENALSQFKMTQLSSESNVQSAEVAVQTAAQQHEQNKRQREATLQQLSDTLRARINTSQVVLEKVLNFLDMTIGASPDFQFGTQSSVIADIGNNDAIGKQNVKNKILDLVKAREESNLFFATDPIRNGQETILFLKSLKSVTQEFYTLVRNTAVRVNFSEAQRQSLQQTTENYLTELSGEILALETQIRTTQTTGEQLELELVQTQNAIEKAESQLQLTQSTSDQQVQIARNQIASTQNLQQELSLKAPFTGIITQRLFDEGALVRPGDPVFTLADRSLLQIETDIPDTAIGEIEKDMPVQITVDGLSETFSGTITRIDPAVDPATRTLGIEITLTDAPAKIRIGMFARAEVELPQKQAFLVPKRFLQSDFLGTSVTTQEGEKIPVELGQERDGMTEIIAPQLHSGITLITH